MAGDFNNFFTEHKKNRARFLSTTRSFFEKYEGLDQTGELDSVLYLPNLSVISDKQGVLREYIYSEEKSNKYDNGSRRKNDRYERRDSSKAIQDNSSREQNNRSPGLVYTDIDEFEETFELSKDLADDVTSYLHQSFDGEREPSDAESIGSSDSYETVGSGYEDSEDSNIATNSNLATIGTSQVDSQSQESSQDESMADVRVEQAFQLSTPKQRRQPEATTVQNQRPLRNETYTINETALRNVKRATSPHLSPYRRKDQGLNDGGHSSPSQSHSTECRQGTKAQGMQSHQSGKSEENLGDERHDLEAVHRTNPHARHGEESQSKERGRRTQSQRKEDYSGSELKTGEREFNRAESYFRRTESHGLERHSESKECYIQRAPKDSFQDKIKDCQMNLERDDNLHTECNIRTSKDQVRNIPVTRKISPRQMDRRETFERPGNVNELFQELKENLHLEENFQGGGAGQCTSKGNERKSPRKREPLSTSEDHNHNILNKKREVALNDQKKVVRRIATQFTPFEQMKSQENLRTKGFENSPMNYYSVNNEFDCHRNSDNRTSPKGRNTGKRQIDGNMHVLEARNQNRDIGYDDKHMNKDHGQHYSTSDKRLQMPQNESFYRSSNADRRPERRSVETQGFSRFDDDRVYYIEDEGLSRAKTHRDTVMIDKFGHDVRRASTPNIKQVTDMAYNSAPSSYQLQTPQYHSRPVQNVSGENGSTKPALQPRSPRNPLYFPQQHISDTVSHSKQARESMNNRNSAEKVPMLVNDIRDSGINTTYEDSAIGNSVNTHAEQPKILSVKNLHRFDKAMQKHSFIMDVSMNASVMEVNMEESVDKVEKWLFGVEESENVANGVKTDNVKTTFDKESFKKHAFMADHNSQSPNKNKQARPHYRRKSQDVDCGGKVESGDNHRRASKGGNDVSLGQRSEETYPKHSSQDFYDEVDSMNVLTPKSALFRNNRGDCQTNVRNQVKQSRPSDDIKLISTQNDNHKISSERYMENSEPRLYTGDERHFKERKPNGSKVRPSPVPVGSYHETVKILNKSPRYSQDVQRSPRFEQRQQRYLPHSEHISPRGNHQYVHPEDMNPSSSHAQEGNGSNRQSGRAPNSSEYIDVEHQDETPDIRLDRMEGIDESGNVYSVDSVQRDGRLKLKIRRGKRSMDKIDGLRQMDVGERMQKAKGSGADDFNKRRLSNLTNKRQFDAVESMDFEEDFVPASCVYKDFVPTPPKSRRLHSQPMETVNQRQSYESRALYHQSEFHHQKYEASPNARNKRLESHENEFRVKNRHRRREQFETRDLDARVKGQQSNDPHGYCANNVEYDDYSDIVLLDSRSNQQNENYNAQTGNKYNLYEIRSSNQCRQKSLPLEQNKKCISNNFNSPKGHITQPNKEPSEFRSPNIERRKLVSSEDFSPSASMSKLRLNTPRSTHVDIDKSGSTNTNIDQTWTDIRFTDSNKALDRSRHAGYVDQTEDNVASSSGVYRNYYQEVAAEDAVGSNSDGMEKASPGNDRSGGSHRRQSSSELGGDRNVKRKSPRQSRKPDYDMTGSINSRNIDALERSISEGLGGERSRHERRYSGPQGYSNHSLSMRQGNSGCHSRLNMSYDSSRLNLNTSRQREFDSFEDVSPGFVRLDSLSGTKSHLRVQMQERNDREVIDEFGRNLNVFRDRLSEKGSLGRNEGTYSRNHATDYNDNIESVSTIGICEGGIDNMSAIESNERLTLGYPQNGHGVENMAQSTSSPKMRKELFSPNKDGGRLLRESDCSIGRSPNKGFKVPGIPPSTIRHSRSPSVASNGQNKLSSAQSQSVTVKRAQISQLSTRDRLKQQLSHQNKNKPHVPPELLQSTPIKPGSKFALDVSMSTIMGSEDPKSDMSELVLI